MQKADIKVGGEYALRESRTPGTPLQHVRIVGVFEDANEIAMMADVGFRHRPQKERRASDQTTTLRLRCGPNTGRGLRAVSNPLCNLFRRRERDRTDDSWPSRENEQGLGRWRNR